MNAPKKKFSRRKFVGLLGLCGLGSIGYSRFIEPGWLTLGKHTVPVTTNPSHAPLKILQLSDFHASPVVDLNFIGKAVKIGLEQQPDVICLTGDFITKNFDEFEAYQTVLRPLAEYAPTFACLGNHDGGMWAGRRGGYKNTDKVVALLKASNIQLLHNTFVQVKMKDWNLSLVGLGDTWAKEIQPLTAFPSVVASDTTATVVLSHNPDTKSDLQNHHWDLMLCGHTHGGQLKLPFLGTPFAPVNDQKYVEGLHRWNDRWIHITRGVGNLHGVRFNCPPEVSLLTLT